MSDLNRFEADQRQLQTLDGATVNYLDKGEGEAIVLLHGYPQNQLAWRRVIEPLATTHRVIALDWVGWGRSEQRLDLRYDYDREVKRLAGFLEKLGLETYNFFGHDYGGYLALGLHRIHRERILRLAILNSRAHRRFPLLRRCVFLTLGFLAQTWGLRMLFPFLPIGSVHRAVIRRELPRDGRGEELLKAYTGWMDQRAGRRWLRVFYEGYRNRERPELIAELGRIQCPTAVVWGTHDGWCPMNIAEELTEAMGAATLTPCPGVGHFVMEEAPAAVLTALTKLLSRTPLDRG